MGYKQIVSLVFWLPLDLKRYYFLMNTAYYMHSIRIVVAVEVDEYVSEDIHMDMDMVRFSIHHLLTHSCRVWGRRR